MQPISSQHQQAALQATRRHFLSRGAVGIGVAALSSLLNEHTAHASANSTKKAERSLTHFAPRAKRVIYLYMAGGPSQFESFDNKPMLRQMHGKALPDSLSKGVKLAFLQNAKLNCYAPQVDFKKCGNSGNEISNLLPHLQSVADELCIARTLETEQVNHDPAHTFMNTGSAIVGRPSFGSWLTYGLGNESENLPGYVVMRSGPDGQPISTINWHSGFLPSRHQGVQFYSRGTPLHYVDAPAGLANEQQGHTVGAINTLNKLHHSRSQDPEVLTRIAQYELAFRMQTSVPELANLKDESPETLAMYGIEGADGSFGANCLMARRMAERGVRFIQLYHTGWDHHGAVKSGMTARCKDVDQPAAALIKDLRQRGLLEDTLVMWGGEFGRTPMAQGSGRDHHTKSGAMFFAGGGINAGTTYGETDPFGFGTAKDPFHVHDFHATTLHLLGIDHQRLTFRYQGRNHRLTDVHGHVIKPMLA